jgi:hypothetical protein
MNTVTKLASPLIVAVVLAFFSAPAHAQFGGDQIAQFSPVLELIKQKIGKRRFGSMMKTMAPMMMYMMGNNSGGFGGGMLGGGSMDGSKAGGFSDGMTYMSFAQGMGGMMSRGSGQSISSLMSTMSGFTGHGGRRRGRGSRHHVS